MVAKPGDASDDLVPGATGLDGSVLDPGTQILPQPGDDAFDNAFSRFANEMCVRASALGAPTAGTSGVLPLVTDACGLSDGYRNEYQCPPQDLQCLEETYERGFSEGSGFLDAGGIAALLGQLQQSGATGLPIMLPGGGQVDIASLLEEAPGANLDGYKNGEWPEGELLDDTQLIGLAVYLCDQLRQDPAFQEVYQRNCIGASGSVTEPTFDRGGNLGTVAANTVPDGFLPYRNAPPVQPPVDPGTTPVLPPDDGTDPPVDPGVKPGTVPDPPAPDGVDPIRGVDAIRAAGALIADCSTQPTQPQCQLHGMSSGLIVDCSVAPTIDICLGQEGALADVCATSGLSDELTAEMCQGRSGQLLYQQCAECLEQNQANAALCAPCMNRKYGILVTDKAKQIDQGEGGKVDILWVLDNSPSMNDERGDIATNFNKFIQRMAALAYDFRIAIVLTDPTASIKGRFVGEVITHDMPDLVARFQAAVQKILTDHECSLPEGECIHEQGLETARIALQMAVAGTAPNTGFYRADASLAIIFVSDSDDMFQRDPQKLYLPAGDRKAQVDYLMGLKTDASKITMSAFVADGSPGCKETCWTEVAGGGYTCQVGSNMPHDNIESVGQHYIDAAKKTGGLVAALCGADFEEVLDHLGANAVGLRFRFPLNEKPDPYSIVVWVDDVIVPRSKSNGWTYDLATNEVVMHGTWIPAPAATIKMSYYVNK